MMRHVITNWVWFLFHRLAWRNMTNKIEGGVDFETALDIVLIKILEQLPWR